MSVTATAPLSKKRVLHQRSRRALVALDDLTILPQVRKSYDKAGMTMLARNMVANGKLNAQQVAVLNKADCERYLEIFNFIFGANYRIGRQVCPTSDGYFYIVIAGHRRTLAERQLGLSHSWVDLYDGITAEHAIRLQISENSYLHPKPEEEAEVFYQLYRLEQNVDAKLSVTKFARQNRASLGRSEQTIRNGIKFCRLPLRVQEMVRLGAIAYGAAVQLTRLVPYLGEDELVDRAKRAFLLRQKVYELRKAVDFELANLRHGQLGIFFESAAQADYRRRLERQHLLERGMIQALKAELSFTNTLIELAQRGILNRDEWPRDVREALLLGDQIFCGLEDLYQLLG